VSDRPEALVVDEESLEFKRSAPFTMGVELELQILNSRDYNLARDAADLIEMLDKIAHPGTVKPEITESMVEINTGIHERHDTLVDELAHIRDAIVKAAQRINVRIAGGGSHPFHQWGERRVYPTERFKHLLDVYGYLAKQFTIFGQHVHIGVAGGDDALYLTHILSRYVPHFIALSASSPFQQGHDTSYESSRLNTVSAFPLSGRAPFIHCWDDFINYYNRMHGLGVIESLKDLYWDIRPKPEYGTVEIRVFDTPLTVERAARLAAYVQALSRHIVAERPLEPSREVYAFYNYNRFQACRYGLRGELVDAYREQRVSIKQDIIAVLAAIRPYAVELGSAGVLEELAGDVEAERTDAAWLRAIYRSHGSLNDVARQQSRLWTNAA
jgi:glutamate---cysteine ligase / carboxylate-amine ligase